MQESIKDAVRYLIAARETVQIARAKLEKCEDALTDLYRKEGTLLKEENYIALDGELYQLNMNCEELTFEGLRLVTNSTTVF